MNILKNLLVTKDYVNESITPDFVDDISECVDTNKTYVLPNGEIVAYTPQVPDINFKYEVRNNGRWEYNTSKSIYGFTENSSFPIALNTNIIEVKYGEQYSYKGCCSWAVGVYWLSDNNEPASTGDNIVSSNKWDTQGRVEEQVATVPFVDDGTGENKVKYAMFTSYVMSSWGTVPTLEVKPLTSVLGWHKTGCAFTTTDGDVLKGKKYVACGDSFTSTTTFASKPYPEIIGERNNMRVTNMAISGSTIVNTGNEEGNHPFSNGKYYAIPRDADYITLMFGLNETEKLKHGEILEGTSESTDNTTLWGAYNEVLNFIITKIPNAKVGVILADSWMTEQYANIVKEICKYWGVAYLDLKGDNMPLGITNDYNVTLTPAQTIRNEQFKASATNGHPNQTAHNFRSTIIENFLRSL